MGILTYKDRPARYAKNRQAKAGRKEAGVGDDGVVARRCFGQVGVEAI